MSSDAEAGTSARSRPERARLLHASPWQGVLHITGGGARLLAELLTTPGASATVLEATVPYAESALAELLGRRPDQACAAPTANTVSGKARAFSTKVGSRVNHTGAWNCANRWAISA